MKKVLTISIIELFGWWLPDISQKWFAFRLRQIIGKKVRHRFTGDFSAVNDANASDYYSKKQEQCDAAQ